MKREYCDHNPLPEDTAVASANECTGLMFTPPENEQEREAYGELFPGALPREEPPAPRAFKACPGRGGQAPRR